MTDHKLVDNTLVRGEGGGILARCVCGWRSEHFSTFAASAAFQDHKETADTTPERMTAERLAELRGAFRNWKESTGATIIYATVAGLMGDELLGRIDALERELAEAKARVKTARAAALEDVVYLIDRKGVSTDIKGRALGDIKIMRARDDEIVSAIRALV